MSARDDIRQAALDNGWTIKARVGERYEGTRGWGVWDRDIFNLGRIERNLQDGTPVVEPEHSVEVWYQRSGQVANVAGNQATVPTWIYHEGIHNVRGQRNKAARVIAALKARTSKIPKDV